MSPVDWLQLPDHVWISVFYHIDWYKRPYLELVCSKWYYLVPYDDIQVEISDRHFSEKLFMRLEAKREVKPLRITQIFLRNPSEVTLAILLANYRSAKLTLEFEPLELVGDLLIALLGKLGHLTALRLEGPGDLPESYIQDFSQNFPNLVHFRCENFAGFPMQLPGSLRTLYLRDVDMLENGNFTDALRNCLNLQEFVLIDCYFPAPIATFPILPQLQYLALLDENEPVDYSVNLSDFLRRGRIVLPALRCLEIRILRSNSPRLSHLPPLTGLEGLSFSCDLLDEWCDLIDNCNAQLDRLYVDIRHDGALFPALGFHSLVFRFQYLTVLKLQMLHAKNSRELLSIACKNLDQLRNLALLFTRTANGLSLLPLASAKKELKLCTVGFSPSVANIPDMWDILRELAVASIEAKSSGGCVRKSRLYVCVEHFAHDVSHTWLHTATQLLKYGIVVSFLRNADKNYDQKRLYPLWNFNRPWYPFTDAKVV